MCASNPAAYNHCKCQCKPHTYNLWLSVPSDILNDRKCNKIIQLTIFPLLLLALRAGGDNSVGGDNPPVDHPGDYL